MVKGKWLVAGLLTAGVACAVALWPRSSALPAVASTLPAATTAAFVAVEGADQLGQHTLQAATEWLPKDATATWLDPGVRKSLMGLDPADPKSWQEAGIDIQRGIASVWDSQVGPGPLALAAVGDAAANDAWWRRQFANVPDQPFPDGPPAAWEARHAVSQTALWVRSAARGDWRAIEPTSLAAEATPGAGLGAWQAAGGPTLDADPVFRAAMEGLPTGPRVVAYVQLSRMLRIVWPRDEVRLLERAESWLSRSWRATSMWWTPGKFGARLVATTAGVETLRKALETDRHCDPVVDALPAQATFAGRVSLNLREVLDAIADQLPPELPEVKSGFAGARLAMPIAMGIGETEFGAALTGHFALAVQGPLQPETFRFWLAVGLRDPAKAEDLLGRLARKLNWQLEKLPDGWKLPVGSLALHIRATEGVWVISNVKEAAATGPAPWREHLRGEAAFAVSLDSTALYDAWALVVGSAIKPPAKPSRWHMTVSRTSTGLVALGDFP